MASVVQALPTGPESKTGRSPLLGAPPDGAALHSLRRHLAAGDAVALAVIWLPVALLAGDDDPALRLCVAAAAIVSTMVAMRCAGLYRASVRALPSREATRTLVAAAVGAAAAAAVATHSGGFTAAAVLSGAAAAAGLVLVLRWRFGRWLKARRAAGQFLRSVLLVGANGDASALRQMLTDEPALGYRVVGVVGDPSGLAELVSRTGAEEIIVVASALDGRPTSAAVGHALAAGVPVQIWPGFMGFSSHRLQFAPVSGIPALSVAPAATATWQMALKRVLDIAVSTLLLPLAAPILLAAAAGIKLEDGGPVLHRHTVIGWHGRPTTVLKLRTMVPNAAQMIADVAAMNERTGGPLFKATHDPRVTRVGRLLRASSIDELPQLWNVLSGRMSLVGPRFALPHEVDQFDTELRRRHQMRPGITGLWQTEARDNPSFSAYRRLDLLYVDNWSLGLDLTILANTAHAVTVRALRAVLPARRPA